ncbi:hypothetical protein OD91_0014 [Lutibacter sp. Hel_I_33_5]|uniref:DUF6452 family protein n=1 Tax=Lutibacter sp. Hel_I_33_5 TaxID=1566289 RepID=UPI0011A86F80|nr:DUF6452 family protein [Lutibacter sp. Hel_I_33_5]TVZ54779.1 hypothetical protein OD91_0014 [Lutibacter sp. Hel_I_33_5]
MRKLILLVVLTLIFAISCEKDDICTSNPITPKLVLRFYDATTPTSLKDVAGLYVWAEGKDSLFINDTKDSISLPLNSQSNQTVYHLSKGTDTGTITIDYTPETDFVSRSCGFRVIFNNVTLTENNTWITDLSTTSLETINNQTTAHVQVFH